MSSSMECFKRRKRRRKGSKRKTDPSALSLHTGFTSDKAAIRVIAPYVNIVRKGRKAAVKPEGDDAHFMFYLKQKPSVLTRHLNEFLDDSVDLHTLIHESVDTLKKMTNAAGARVYLIDQMTQEIYLASRHVSSYLRRICWKVEEGKTVAAHVASTIEPIIVEDVVADPRFSEDIPYTDAMVKSVLCVPVVTPANECYAVLELFRDILQDTFTHSDLRISASVASWMGTAVYMNEQRIVLTNQHQLNNCLLELTRCYFTDIRLFDKMVLEIVSLAKSSLNAERATFYVIDPHKDDLVCDIYDESIDRNDDLVKRNLKLRFGRDRGIARHVALTGKSLNLRDAFNDTRFVPEIDEKTGAITRSVLCMPVQTAEGIVGVIQAINKVGDIGFTHYDEQIFGAFSIYCALALHYSHVCKVNRRAKARGEVVTGLIKRHVQPCPHEVLYTTNHLAIYENPEALCYFAWYIDLEHLDYMPQIAVHMVMEVAGPDAIDRDELIKYTLALRNFYRPIGYHNWEHGFNVCHCMYNIIIRNRYKLTAVEKKALMIATLAHDVDHGGVTNNFLVTTHDVMSQLHEVSPWESHHYETLMMILTEIHVFKDISAEEYAEVSQLMKHAILSTDLAYFFRIKSALTEIVSDEHFCWGYDEHRQMGLSIMMTICDLSGQCKPFPVAKRLTDNLYLEFYAQGDCEREMGLQPLSLMDRTKEFYQPEDQIIFLRILVLPVAEMIGKILDDCWNLYELADALKADWEEVIRVRDTRCWRQEDSTAVDDVKIKV